MELRYLESRVQANPILHLRLIDSGATLISDDITLFSKSQRGIDLFSVEKTRGLLEVRQIGIITVPYIDGINLKLIVQLTDSNVERVQPKKILNFLDLNYQRLKLMEKKFLLCC